MDPATIDSHFCCKHKLKIWGSIIAVILIAGLVGSIVIVVTYATKSEESCEDSCLNFTQAETCLATEENPYRQYGTKTNYDVAKAVIENTTVQVKATECKPVFFYLLSRHAIRYPDKKGIKEMGIILPDLRTRIINSSLCSQDVENLQMWQFEMKEENGSKITTSGLKQAEEIGVRFKEMFPSLLNESFSADAYEFLVSSKNRTKQTAKAFARGLFGKGVKGIKYPENDALLRFYSICRKYSEQENGSTAEQPEEMVKFRNGSLMEMTLDDIATRLGFNATFDDVDKMYFACAFGYAINQTDSPWCSVFTTSNIKVFEYYYDLEDYYVDAYGNPRNARQACPIIKDLVQQLRQAKDGTQPKRKALMYFSHSEALKKVFAHLGIYQDSAPLKANRFCCSEDRKWRSSIISPFNANLAVVLYKCGEAFSVEAYLQEKPLIIAGCRTTPCPWEDFEKHYLASSDDCDLQKICVP